jgi:hypothetical protein
VISGNICHDNAGSGIFVFNGATPVTTQSGIVISNNRCYNNCKIGAVASSGADIFIERADNITIIGNNISANGTSAGQVSGIFLGPSASHVSVFHNQIYNVGQGRVDGAAIWTQAPNSIFVSGNHTHDEQAIPTMASSVVGTAGPNNVYVGNNFARPFALAMVSDTVASNVIQGRLTMLNLPLAATSLPTGAVWRNGTVLNIV